MGNEKVLSSTQNVYFIKEDNRVKIILSFKTLLPLTRQTYKDINKKINKRDVFEIAYYVPAA
jgi:hypothetical protein